MALYKIGEIRKGSVIGKRDLHKFAWLACPICSKERWVRLTNLKENKEKTPICRACNIRISRKQDRRVELKSGYIDIWLEPNDFFFPMTRPATQCKYGGYVFEHRLVMAKYLGRCLNPWEIVHHIDRVRNHNDISNLKLVQEMQHKQITLVQNRITTLENEVRQLKTKNKVLAWQVNQLQQEVSNRII